MPEREDLPEQYRDILNWYETEFNKVMKSTEAAIAGRGASAETLMRLVGSMSREDADELIRIIDDGCGRVDANEW